jgi:hypothetical protein
VSHRNTLLARVDVMIFNIFAQKIDDFDPKVRLFYAKIIMALIFKKIANFCAENWRKLRLAVKVLCQKVLHICIFRDGCCATQANFFSTTAHIMY